MEKKIVRFDEDFYGFDGAIEIVKDGRKLAARCTAPPEGKVLIYGSLKEAIVNGDKSAYNNYLSILKIEGEDFEEDIDSGHSGLSFSAVFFAAGTFLLGHDILVLDTELVTGL